MTGGDVAVEDSKIANDLTSTEGEPTRRADPHIQREPTAHKVRTSRIAAVTAVAALIVIAVLAGKLKARQPHNHMAAAEMGRLCTPVAEVS
jgi:hypothetical protein